SRLWHGDITPPFPPSWNEGYIRNQDIPCLSVTTLCRYVVMRLWGPWKVPQPLNAVTTCGAAHVDKPQSVRQMLRKGRNLTLVLKDSKR
ncbi:hypothetical protein M9458_007889, partial [Cirrhinus mrigala]